LQRVSEPIGDDAARATSGVTLRLDGDHGLAIGPRRLLTDNDRVQIRQHKAELLAIVANCETVQ
jgi:hypothetical protein